MSDALVERGLERERLLGLARAYIDTAWLSACR